MTLSSSALSPDTSHDSRVLGGGRIQARGLPSTPGDMGGHSFTHVQVSPALWPQVPPSLFFGTNPVRPMSQVQPRVSMSISTRTTSLRASVIVKALRQGHRRPGLRFPEGRAVDTSSVTQDLPRHKLLAKVCSMNQWIKVC